MLEGLAEYYLLRYLGEYVVGVDKQNLSVSTWSGEIHLRNARLKQAAVELLNLPFRLLFGEVGLLKINAPWNLMGSRPVVIEIRRLHLLLGPKPTQEWSEAEETRRVQLHRQKMIDKTDLLCDLKFGMGVGDPNKEGFKRRIFARISDNVEVHIHDFHLRFEDEAPGGNFGAVPFCAGVHLSSLHAQTASEIWAPTFVQNRGQTLNKLLTVGNLSAYHVNPSWAWSTCATSTCADADLREHFGPEGQHWGDTFATDEKYGRVSHILPPVSGKLRLTQSLDIADAATPQFALSCELERIKCYISRASYAGMSGISSLVSEYFAFQEVVRHRIEAYCRGWPQRPQVPLKEDPRAWWRYAARCSRLEQSARLAATEQTHKRLDYTWRTLVSPDGIQRLKLQDEYICLVRRLKSAQLMGDDETRMQLLEASLQLSDLLRWRAKALEQLQQGMLHERAEQEREAARKSWGSLFSWRNQEARSDGDWDSFDGLSRSASPSRYVREASPVGPRLRRPSAGEASHTSNTDQTPSVLLGSRLALETDVRGHADPCEGLAPASCSPSSFEFLPSVGTWLSARRPCREQVVLEDTAAFASLASVRIPEQDLTAARVPWEKAALTELDSVTPEPESEAEVEAVGVHQSSSPPALKVQEDGNTVDCEVRPEPEAEAEVNVMESNLAACARPVPHGVALDSTSVMPTSSSQPPEADHESRSETSQTVGVPPACSHAEPAKQSCHDTFAQLPSVGTWLHVPAARASNEGNSQNGPLGLRRDDFTKLPSVGTWLQVRAAKASSGLGGGRDAAQLSADARAAAPSGWRFWGAWFFSKGPARAGHEEERQSQQAKAPQDSWQIGNVGESQPVNTSTTIPSTTVQANAQVSSGWRTWWSSSSGQPTTHFSLAAAAAPHASSGPLEEAGSAKHAPAPMPALEAADAFSEESTMGDGSAGDDSLAATAGLSLVPSEGNIASLDAELSAGLQQNPFVEVAPAIFVAEQSTPLQQEPHSEVDTASLDAAFSAPLQEKLQEPQRAWLFGWFGGKQQEQQQPHSPSPLPSESAHVPPEKTSAETPPAVPDSTMDARASPAKSWWKVWPVARASASAGDDQAASTSGPGADRTSAQQDGNPAGTPGTEQVVADVSQSPLGVSIVPTVDADGQLASSVHASGFASDSAAAVSGKVPQIFSPVEAEFLRLRAEVPEVVLELQTKDNAKTVFSATKIELKCFQGEDLGFRVDVADLGLSSELSVVNRRRRQTVVTRLVYREEDACASAQPSNVVVGREPNSEGPRSCDSEDASDGFLGDLDAILSVEYISRQKGDEPWIKMHGRRLVFFYQQELFLEITDFLANAGNETATHSASATKTDAGIRRAGFADAVVPPRARRAFDRWRRRAKVLLYSRGRPRLSVRLDKPSVVLPSRPLPVGRLRRRVDQTSVLVFQPVLLTAQSEEVTKKEAQTEKVAAGSSCPASPRKAEDCVAEAPTLSTLSRADRWSVAIRGACLQHFASHAAVLVNRHAQWTIMENLSLETECLFKRHSIVAELGKPPQTAHSIELLQPPTVSDDAGRLPELVLNLDARAYDSLIRAVRLLLKSPTSKPAPTQEPLLERNVSHDSANSQDDNSLRDNSPHGSFNGAVERERMTTCYGPSEFGEVSETSPVAKSGDMSDRTPGSPMIRARFASALSNLSLGSPVAKRPTPARLSLKVELRFHLLAIRFFCLPDPEDCVELRAPDSCIEVASYTDRTTLELGMPTVQLLRPSAPEETFDRRLVLSQATPGSEKVSIKIVIASQDTAKENYTEGAETFVGLDLGHARVVFSPHAFREFISFAKSTPQDTPPEGLTHAFDGRQSKDDRSDPLCYRVRVVFPNGIELAWVDEATGLYFAESHMKRSTILLDLREKTAEFHGSFGDFDIEDRSSDLRPSILRPSLDSSYDLKVRARTFTVGSRDFAGYHTEVSMNFSSIQLTYMHQKFMRCWSWMLSSFLPAITTSARERLSVPQGSNSDEEDGGGVPEEGSVVVQQPHRDRRDSTDNGATRNIFVRAVSRIGSKPHAVDGNLETASLKSDDGSASFVSIPEEPEEVAEYFAAVGMASDMEYPNVAQSEARPSAGRGRSVSSSEVESACDEASPDLFVEAAVADGEQGQQAAWAAAERAARSAARFARTASLRGGVDHGAPTLPTFTRLKVLVEKPIISLPVWTSGAGSSTSAPHVRVQADSIEVTNAPCRDADFGLLDAVTLNIQAMEMVAMSGFKVFESHSLSVRVDRPLEVRVPPLPMRVTWRSQILPLRLTPRHFSLLCAIFKQNVTGEDPHVPAKPPPQITVPASSTPIWLEFNLDWRYFECIFREDYKADACASAEEVAQKERGAEFATLTADRVDLRLRKHAAPRVLLNCVLRAAKLCRSRGGGVALPSSSPAAPFSCMLGRVSRRQETAQRSAPQLTVRVNRSADGDNPGRVLPPAPSVRETSTSEEKQLGVDLRGSFLSESGKEQRIELQAEGPRVIVSLPLFYKMWDFFMATDPVIEEEWRLTALAPPTSSAETVISDSGSAGKTSGINSTTGAATEGGRGKEAEQASAGAGEAKAAGGSHSITRIKLTNATAVFVHNDNDPHSQLLAVHHASLDLQLSSRETTQRWLYRLQTAHLARCHTVQGLREVERAAPDQAVALGMATRQGFRALTDGNGISLGIDDLRVQECDPSGQRRRKNFYKLTCQPARARMTDRDYKFCLACFTNGHLSAPKRPVKIEEATEIVIDDFQYVVQSLQVTIATVRDQSGEMPFLDLRFSPFSYRQRRTLCGQVGADASCHDVLEIDREFDMSVQASLFNPTGVCWEPLLEAPSATEAGASSDGYAFKLRHVQSAVDSTGQKVISSVARLPSDCSKSTQVSFSSSDLLLLNCCDTFWRAFAAYHSVWSDIFSGRSEPFSAMADDFDEQGHLFAPFSVRNNAGEFLRIKSNGAQVLRVAVGETRRLTELRVNMRENPRRGRRHYVEIGVCLFDNVRGVPLDRVGQYVFQLARRASSFPGLEVFGPLEPSSPVSRPPGLKTSRMRGQTTRRSSSFTNLVGAAAEVDRDSRDPSLSHLICRVQVENDLRKVLVVESPIMLCNNLRFPVKISVDDTEWPEALQPGETLPVPVAQCQLDGFRIQPVLCRKSDIFYFEWLDRWPHQGPFSFDCAFDGSDGKAGYFHCCAHRTVETIPYGSCTAKQYTIHLRAPFTLLSTLPVPVFCRVFVRKRGAEAWKGYIEPGGREQVCAVKLSKRDAVSLQLSLAGERHLSLPLVIWGDAWSEPGILSSSRGQKKVEVPAFGSGGKRSPIRLQVLLQSSGSEPPEVVLHTPVWVVDHIRLPSLELSWDSGEIGVFHGGNGVAVPVDCEATQVCIGWRGDKSPSASHTTHVHSLGCKTAFVESGPDAKNAEKWHFDLGVRCVEHSQICNLSVRAIYIAPLYVFVNASGWAMSVRQVVQVDAQAPVMRLTPQQRAPFHRSHVGNDFAIQVLLHDDDPWEWSGRLPIHKNKKDRLPRHSVGEYSFQCFRRAPTVFENLHLEIRSVEATFYVIIRALNPRLAERRICNHSVETLRFRQARGEAPALELPPGASAPFAWYSVDDSQRQLEITRAWAASTDGGGVGIVDFEPGWLVDRPRRLNLKQKRGSFKTSSLGAGSFSSSMRGSTDLQLLYHLRMRGPTLVLTVQAANQGETSAWDVQRASANLQVSLQFAGIRVSVVVPIVQSSVPSDPASPQGASNFWSAAHAASHDEMLRSELLLLSVSGLRAEYKRSAKHDTLVMRLEDLQVDNQREDAVHAVALSRGSWDGPSGFGTSQSSMTRVAPLVRLHVCRVLDPDILYFDEFNIEVRGLELRLDTGLILDVVDVWQGLRREDGSTTGMLANAAVGADPLVAEAVSREGQKLHFKSLSISDCRVSLTFSGGSGLRNSRAHPRNIGFWQRLLASVSSVENLSFHLGAFGRKHSTMPTAMLQAELQEHFFSPVSQWSQVLFPVLGSLEVLGNPRSAFTHCTEACRSFFCEPYSGAMRSLEDALEGSVRGASSCMRNAVFGICHSLATVSGAASQGCLVCLSDDPRAARGRLRPEHQLGLRDRLRLGAGSLATGCFGGITGLVLEPVRGVRQGSFRAIVCGCGQGCIGLVLRPSVGCCEFTSQAAEGISRKAIAGDERRRLRLPRTLYSSERVLRAYSPRDAEVKAFLCSCDAQFRAAALLDYVWDTYHTSVVVATETFLVHASQENHSVVLRVALQDIARASYCSQSRCVRLYLDPRHNRRPRRRSGSGGLGRAGGADATTKELRLNEEAAMRRVVNMVEGGLSVSNGTGED